MKIVLKIALFLGVIVLTAFSCEEDDGAENILSFEIPVNGDIKTAELEKGNILIKYCLLNEDSIPETTFNDKENFIFSFSIENKNDFNIIINSFMNQEFFKVYQKVDGENVEVGRPWTGTWCNFSGHPREFNLSSGEILSFKIPWSVVPGESTYELYPFCFGEHNPLITLGEYFTRLDFDLNYKSSDKEFAINNISIKINFELI